MSHLAHPNPSNTAIPSFLARTSSQGAAVTLQRRLQDRQFLGMEQAFRASGGMASGDDLVRLLRRQADQPISLLARWIVAREVIAFEHQSSTLLPLFQFDVASAKLRPSVSDVIRELSEVFDSWDLALWFAEPNGWLDDRAPVHLIGTDAQAVLCAARADRFVARG